MKKPLHVAFEKVGPHTACCLLGLWSEGKIELSLEEFRYLNKCLAQFLEQLEEVRENVFMIRE